MEDEDRKDPAAEESSNLDRLASRLKEAGEKINPAEVVDRTRDFILDVVQEYVRRPVKEAGHRVESRVARTAIGVTLVCTAMVFLLIGLLSLLIRELGPDKGWLAYVIVGVIALGFGTLTLVNKKGD